MKPYAMWTHDCQGKQDYDGNLLSISTRYWPGPEGGGSFTFDSRTGKFGTLPYGKQPSAHAAIHLCLGPREPDDGGGDSVVWRDASFEAATEAEVKAQVEAWVQARFDEVVMLLGGPSAFRKL